MQVELFGCTSAGKSSMVRKILHSHPERQPPITCSDDFLLQRMRLAWVSGTARVIALNIFSIAMCVVAWRKYRELLRYSVNCIRQLSADVSLFERLRIFRITLRNIGLHEFVERYAAAEEVVFSDEGMLQIAHYLFVHIAVVPRAEQIETFVALVPLPAAVVYVRQPDVLLVERTLQRGHKRVPGDSVELVKRFIGRATTTFEILIQQPAIGDKLLILDVEREVLTAPSSNMEFALAHVFDLVSPAVSAAEQHETISSVSRQAT